MANGTTTRRILGAFFALSAVVVLHTPEVSAQAARVEITPERAEIEVTGTAQLQAQAMDGAGRILDGVAVRWIASTPELAREGVDGVLYQEAEVSASRDRVAREGRPAAAQPDARVAA